MPCQKCQSERVAHVSGKCSDLFFGRLGAKEIQDYVPSDIGIGGGDYMTFDYCLDCGQIQGKFPLEETSMEECEE